jgi:hypothetical protein
MGKAGGQIDEATHGGGKRDAEGQASAENRLKDSRRVTEGPVRKRLPKKGVPKKPVAHDRD